MKRKIKNKLASVLCLIMLINVFAINVNASTGDVSADQFLLETGMTQEAINKLDPDIKGFMVNDMKNAGGDKDFSYIESRMMAPRVNQVLSGIQFSVSSFKSGSTIYIYPTYEFTTPKRPRGEDSFAFQLGDAMRPLVYGGQMWFKDPDIPAYSNWTVADSMVANTQGFNGAEYSGNQLGTPDWDLYLKGCAYCHAEVGTGSDKRIIMSYLHNPGSQSYSISFSYEGLGITYNAPSGSVYTAASTAKLTY